LRWLRWKLNFRSSLKLAWLKKSPRLMMLVNEADANATTLISYNFSLTRTP
jgi:hypothetical protein